MIWSTVKLEIIVSNVYTPITTIWSRIYIFALNGPVSEFNLEKEMMEEQIISQIFL